MTGGQGGGGSGEANDGVSDEEAQIQAAIEASKREFEEEQKRIEQDTKDVADRELRTKLE